MVLQAEKAIRVEREPLRSGYGAACGFPRDLGGDNAGIGDFF